MFAEVTSEARTQGFGPKITPDGTLFSLWAPLCETVSLRLIDEDADRIMHPTSGGRFELFVENIGAGADYAFVLPDGRIVPDPVSRHQPADAVGPSRLVDTGSFSWTDAAWTTRPWHETVLYECHIGTFTPDGTYRAAIERLDHLVALGITALQLMPLADFPGRFGWGYDGVSLYAPDASYGTPDDLRALVDAAHAMGLMVFFDVVYNHFGPEGNFAPAYSPILSDEHNNDYGKVPNFDGPQSATVRELIIDNVLFWFDEFHADGLRFDAIHAIEDKSHPHILEDIVAAVHEQFPGKHLMPEDSTNQAGWLKRGEDGTPLYFTAQWSDDIHHCLHVIANGDQQDYYANYFRPIPQLGRALTEGYVYQGEHRPTHGHGVGEPSAHLPPTAFIAYLQNHDQVGNRPFGDRLIHSSAPEARAALATVYLLAPTIPLVFMGEEFDATTPFPYFCDLGDWLHEAIRDSRRDLLKEWPHPPGATEPPDPFAQSTFESAKLDWSEAERNTTTLTLYRDLIALRHAEIVPRLAGIGGHAGRYTVTGDHLLEMNWRLAGGTTLRMLANLGPDAAKASSPDAGRRLWLTGAYDGTTLAAWSVVVSLL